jgi:hypothetical protein
LNTTDLNLLHITETNLMLCVQLMLFHIVIVKTGATVKQKKVKQMNSCLTMLQNNFLYNSVSQLKSLIILIAILDVINDLFCMFDLVKIAHDEQQIRSLFHRQEPGPRHVDAAAVVKTLHRSSDGSLTNKTIQNFIIDFLLYLINKSFTSPSGLCTIE